MDKSLLKENWEWAQKFWLNKCQELSIPVEKLRMRTSKRIRRILSNTGWILKINYHFKGAGICKYAEREVHITAFRLCQDRHYIKNTILHEIAHILTPGHHHDFRWKQAAIFVGAKPYTSYGPFEPYRYYKVCPNGCSKRGYHNRIRCNDICAYCDSNFQFVKNC